MTADRASSPGRKTKDPAKRDVWRGLFVGRAGDGNCGPRRRGVGRRGCGGADSRHQAVRLDGAGQRACKCRTARGRSRPFGFRHNPSTAAQPRDRRPASNASARASRAVCEPGKHVRAAIRARGDGRSVRPAGLCRHGGLGGGGMLQHRRSEEARAHQAYVMVRSARAALQGQDHHAASGLFRHRLLPCLGVDPAVRRGARLGIHGPPAREHRLLQPFGLGAVQAGRGGRISARHLGRNLGRRCAPQGRADRRADHEGRRRLGDGYGGDPARHQESRGGQAADGLCRFAPRQRAVRQLREPGRHARHRQQHSGLSSRGGRVDDQERFRLGVGQSRPHPCRMDQALRGQGREEERGALRPAYL